MEYPKSAQRLPICLASPWPSPRHSPGRPLPKARAHPISLCSLEDDCSSACDHFLRASPVGRHIVNTAKRGRGAGFHAPRWEPKGPRGQIKDLHRSQRALPRTAARTEYARARAIPAPRVHSEGPRTAASGGILARRRVGHASAARSAPTSACERWACLLLGACARCWPVGCLHSKLCAPTPAVLYLPGEVNKRLSVTARKMP